MTLRRTSQRNRSQRSTISSQRSETSEKRKERSGGGETVGSRKVVERPGDHLEEESEIVGVSESVNDASL